MIEGIVFDLDDTLYPESSYVASGFNVVAKWVSINFLKDETECYDILWGFFKDGIRGDTFNRLLDKFRIDSKLYIDILVDIYHNHEPNILPYKDAEELLKVIKPKYKIGLLSDGVVEIQLKKLTALKLDKFFDAIVISDELGRENWKPSILPYNTICNRLGVPPQNTVYVADNPLKDFKGTKSIGMHSVRIHRHEGLYYFQEAPNEYFCPDYEITDLCNLVELIENIRQ